MSLYFLVAVLSIFYFAGKFQRRLLD